ncbi:NfeD family protein [Rhizobium sp. SG2393]|uniref:NfeD family protein n=1 Tax=Rhizobium sp. SG2393 TaxID=3276279 RepID=UPI00366DEF77
MIARIILELGPWIWWVAGFVLLAAEVVVPGVFLVWIGIAALLTGLASLALWETSWWTWHVQVIVFALLSIAATLAGRRLLGGADGRSDEPHLNQRTASLIGRTAVLEQPIAEGRGRIRLDDTVWSVEGPDVAAGTRVRVTGGTNGTLRVEPA